ncbi:uncharacterized protein METZ01_LOCUS344040 [marine metagenome]|uniref:Uncharacterized protein n=1 Tax=marine metagenome TaxID=408172 RepID=A0A382R0H3_9ZZZZ
MRHQLATAQLNSVQFTAPAAGAPAGNDDGACSSVIENPIPRLKDGYSQDHAPR